MKIEIVSPAPILNTPDFDFAFGGKSGHEIPLDQKQQPYCFEFVALQGMTFQVERVLNRSSRILYLISCPWYLSSCLYVDHRFTKPSSSLPGPPPIPQGNLILNHMANKIGTPYVWGGNWSLGIPETLIYYPPKGILDERTALLWTLKGLDCSGLLFEATQGATPRNTAELIHFGTPVKKETTLKPLDMMVYPGHVLFVLDEKKTIESKFPFGVLVRDLSERLETLDQERTRVDVWHKQLDPQKHYIVRRFANV